MKKKLKYNTIFGQFAISGLLIWNIFCLHKDSVLKTYMERHYHLSSYEKVSYKWL